MHLYEHKDDTGSNMHENGFEQCKCKSHTSYIASLFLVKKSYGAIRFDQWL